MKKNPTWQKTVSWMIVSFILIAATGWYEFGNLWVAVMASAWATLFKIPLYSLHEHLWGKVIFGKGKPEQVPTVDVEPVKCCECAA